MRCGGGLLKLQLNLRRQGGGGVMKLGIKVWTPKTDIIYADPRFHGFMVESVGFE
jgi:hypothetical protein